MQYKTIILEMLQERPALHDRLSSSKRLISTMDQLSKEFREVHLRVIDQLAEARPDSDPSQLSSEALEIALRSMEELLNSDLLS